MLIDRTWLMPLSINNSNNITMAKKAKKVKTAKGAELRIVNPDAAGIDIADGIMQVCVPADRSKDNNRASEHIHPTCTPSRHGSESAA